MRGESCNLLLPYWKTRFHRHSFALIFSDARNDPGHEARHEE
jgi:hypothetical protein